MIFLFSGIAKQIFVKTEIFFVIHEKMNIMVVTIFRAKRNIEGCCLPRFLVEERNDLAYYSGVSQ